MKFNLKQDKGIAGLTILLSLVVILFVIGLLVMIFSITGSGLADAVYTPAEGSLANETLLFSDGGTDTSVASLRHISLSNVVVTNSTGGEIVPSTNYTVSGGTITAVGSSAYNGTNVNVSASYSYWASNTATDSINETASSISGVTSWFTIFIVIGAMVVLITLTVLIIVAIRGSGLLTA